MKKELVYFDHLYQQVKSNIILEEDNKDTETEISVDATATINGQEVPVTVNAKQDVNIDNVNIEKVDINVNIKNLKLKLESQLDDIKKKLYAARLYSKNVGNNLDALRDYGYFMGQKNILVSILKELTELENNLNIDEMENNENE